MQRHTFWSIFITHLVTHWIWTQDLISIDNSYSDSLMWRSSSTSSTVSKSISILLQRRGLFSSVVYLVIITMTAESHLLCRSLCLLIWCPENQTLSGGGGLFSLFNVTLSSPSSSSFHIFLSFHPRFSPFPPWKHFLTFWNKRVSWAHHISSLPQICKQPLLQGALWLFLVGNDV